MSSARLPAPALPRLLKLREVASILRCTTRTVQKWLELGKLRPIRLSPRALRIADDDVLAFLEAARATPPVPRARQGGEPGEAARERADQGQSKAATPPAGAPTLQFPPDGPGGAS